MFEQFSYFLFFLQIYNNINNTYDIIYDAHIMAQSHCESSPGSLDECWLSTRWLSTLRLSQTTWAVSPPIGCYHPHPLLPFYYYSARAILYFKNCDVYTCMLGICPLSRHVLRKWPSWTSVRRTYPNLNQGIDVCGQRKVSGGWEMSSHTWCLGRALSRRWWDKMLSLWVSHMIDSDEWLATLRLWC